MLDLVRNRTGVACLLIFGRGGEIRTPGSMVPNQVSYRWTTPQCCGGFESPPRPCGARAATVSYSDWGTTAVLFSHLRIDLSCHLDRALRPFVCHQFNWNRQNHQVSEHSLHEATKKRALGCAAPGLVSRLYVLIPNRWHTLRRWRSYLRRNSNRTHDESRRALMRALSRYSVALTFSVCP